MTTLKNCEKCGNVFNAESGEFFCAGCTIAEAKDLKKVKDFLNKNPLASAIDVNKKTGITQQQLGRFVKNGSLKMRVPSNAQKCRICGRELLRGAMCSGCREKIENMQKKGKKE